MAKLNNISAIEDDQEWKFPILSITKGGLHFSKHTVELLGNPDYVQILINEDSTKTAIMACDKTDEGAIKFNKSTVDGKRRGRNPKNPEASARKAAKKGLHSVSIKSAGISNTFGRLFDLSKPTTKYSILGNPVSDNGDMKAIVYNLKRADKKTVKPRGRVPKAKA